MRSAIYVGMVEHYRKTPKVHRFAYRLFMLYVDLDELDYLFTDTWLWSAKHFNIGYFRRADYLGPAQTPLKQAVYQLVKQRLNIELDGPVRLLTHLRYFGYGFNPVSFYYCYDKQDKELICIIAEITNTPWGEQYCYVLNVQEAAKQSQLLKFNFNKIFHVSPFMSLDYQYEWLFSQPNERLFVHMKNWQAEACHFTATLDMHRHEFNKINLRKSLLNFPLMTLKVSAGIYWQALKLWMKKIPFYPHPHNLPLDKREK